MVLTFLEPHGTRLTGYLSITLARNSDLPETCISNGREQLHQRAIASVVVVRCRIASRSGNAQKGTTR
jgi:hypothetical protein